LAPEFDTTEICAEWNRTKESLEKAAERAESMEDSDLFLKETVGKLLHIVYCRKAPYLHDYGDGFGIFGAIGRCKGITKDNTPLDVYVMAGSEYLRMKNRLCMGLREIQEQAERI